MRYSKRKRNSSSGCQQGCRQNPLADNQFEARIKRIYEVTGIKNDAQLARALGMRPQSVNSARKRKKVPYSWIKKIADKYKISSDWIWFGEGPMRREKIRVAEPRAEYRKSPEIPAPQGINPQDFDLVPIVETYLSAGAGAFVPSEMICGYCAFRKDWLHRFASSPKNAVLVPVRGPSMEPTIMGGDMLMIDRGRVRIYDGCIYAIGIGETISIKRLYPLLSGRIRLVSDNEKYPPEEILPEELRIIGQVIWFARELIK
jgi:phage repressor protein C with HTH and peptisase S24 domain